MPQAQTMQIPKYWPLVTQPNSRAAGFQKDARLVNCYAEKDFDDGYQVEKRFGLGPAAFTFPPGQGYGLYRYSYLGIPSAGIAHFVMMAVKSSAGLATLYCKAPAGFVPVLGSNPFILGQVSIGGPNNVSKIQYASVPGFSNNTGALFLTNGTQPYFVSGAPTTGGLTQINTISQGGNYPNFTVPGVAVLDGTVYVMDIVGNIFGSNLQDPTTWTALNVIQANAEGDGGVALAKQLVYVVALKETTTQFYFDNGNATGSPLSPVPGALLPYGCMSADTLAKIDGILLWATSNDTNSAQILRLENLSHKIVSTPAIERQLDLASPTSIFYSWAIKHAGHRFYVITNKTSNVTMVYDIDQNLWYQWTDFAGNYYPMISQSIDLSGNHIAQHENSGIVYFIDADSVYPTDNGTNFPVDIYTPNLDFQIFKDKTLPMIYFDSDMVRGSMLQCRYSDDDYQTFSNFRTVDLSLRKPQLADEGTFWRRAYNFRHNAPTPFRITAVGLEMDIGSS